MPHINQRKYHSHLHKVKRLHHTYRHGEHMMISNLPSNIIDENFLGKTSKYIKFFDYPLPQLLADHSTDPLQNITRQYIDNSLNISNEGRFANHEMIIRRNGETTILRPRQDLVLANGFTPVIRPSSILPSYESIMSHSQVASSLSIMDKMSVKKTEQTSIIKTKRKDRRGRKRCNEKFLEQNNFSDHHFSNEFDHHKSQESNFIHFVKEALHNILEEKKYLPPQPVPLMSILPQFHSPYNQSFTPRLEETYFNQNTIQSPCFNEQQFLPPLDFIPNNTYKESSYDFPSEQYRNFEQFNSPQQEHVCLQSLMSLPRNYTHIPGYFFN